MFKRIYLAISLILLLSIPSSGQQFMPDIVLTSPNGIWTDSRTYNTLQDAITAIGANERDLYIARSETVTALTIPANIRLKFFKNGAINNSGLLTINTRHIEAPDSQIFTGTGTIDFANGTTVSSAWFGTINKAITDTSNDNVTLIISKQEAITASVAVGNNVRLVWEKANNKLTANAGVTLSNIRSIEAPDVQLFVGAGDFDFYDGITLRLPWFASLRSALTWIENERLTLVIPKSTWPVDISIASNANTNIKMEQGAILSIANGVTLTINGSFDAGLNQAFDWAGTGKVVFGPGQQKRKPEWWGAIPDGATDSTDAITAAWNSLFESNQYFASGALGLTNIDFTQGPILEFAQGKYIFNGPALTATSYINFKVTGQGSGLTRIENQYDDWFISLPTIIAGEISGFQCYGGKGILVQTTAGINVARQFIAKDIWTIGYTQCGIGFNATDRPYIKVLNSVFRGATGSTPIGLALPSQLGGVEIEGNTFENNTYHLKVRDSGGVGTTIAKNSFLRLAGTPVPSHDLWIVPSTTLAHSGLFITKNKFGPENRGAGDYFILIADEDAGTGSNNYDRTHSTSDSTGYCLGVNIRDNYMAGTGASCQPYIVTYCPNTDYTNFDNILDGTLPSYFINYLCTLTTYNNYSRNNQFFNNNIYAGTTRLNPAFSDENGVGFLHDPFGFRQSDPGQPTYPGSGRSISYAKLLTNDNVNTHGSLSNCARQVSPLTDAIGGTNAVTLRFSSTAGYDALTINTASLVTGKLAWLEFDLKLTGGAQDMTSIDVRIYNGGNVNAKELQRILTVPSAWKRIRIPFIPRQNAALGLVFMGTSYTASTTDIDIGRPAVYHAEEPETITFSWGSFTNTINVASTTVTDVRATTVSKIVLTPTAAVSAAEVASTYISAKALGSFTVTHPNNATAGRTWDYHIAN